MSKKTAKKKNVMVEENKVDKLLTTVFGDPQKKILRRLQRKVDEINDLSEKYENYAQKVLRLLENSDIRTLIDNRAETMGKKIREAETQKVPYMLIVGENEEKEGTVSVRKRGGEDLGSMSVEAFAKLINDEVAKSISKFAN